MKVMANRPIYYDLAPDGRHNGQNVLAIIVNVSL